MKNFFKNSNRLEIFLVVIFCSLAVGLLSIGINRPFIGHHDDNNQYYAGVGKNYLDYGVINLKFGQLIPGSVPASRNFYTHHPPLLSLALAGSIALLGSHYWSVRLVPIIFSVLTLVIFYFLLRRFYPASFCGVSLLFWLITPMFLFFGKMADHEAPTLFFLVLSLYFYTRWLKVHRASDFHFLLASLFLGQWTGWPAYYLAGALFLLTRRWEILVLSLGDFGLFLLDTYLLTGSVIGGGLGEILLFRTGAINSLSWVRENYTNTQLLHKEIMWLYHFFTPFQFFVTLITLFLSIYFWIRQKAIPQQGLVWLVFLFIAAIHVVLFRTGAWRHDYWLYYFLPFFAWGMSQSLFLIKKTGVKVNQAIIYAGYFISLAISFYFSQPFFWALQNIVVKY